LGVILVLGEIGSETEKQMPVATRTTMPARTDIPSSVRIVTYNLDTYEYRGSKSGMDQKTMN